MPHNSESDISALKYFASGHKIELVRLSDTATNRKISATTKILDMRGAGGRGKGDAMIKVGVSFP